MYEIPILLLVFNRPDTTSQVFERLRIVQPKFLFVGCDGPRRDLPLERDSVQAVRDIVSKVDWNCEVKYLFRENNLGCKEAVSSAIDWFFSQVDMGIILEDDCLPDVTFFQFCKSMLYFYQNDHRIFQITGNNFQNGRVRGSGSYYFSKYPHIWGWATWRRAWKHRDMNLGFWPKWSGSSEWRELFDIRAEEKMWRKHFQDSYEGVLKSWAYPWTASVWFHGGLTVTPNVNIVRNIGFGLQSTHTSNKNDPNSKMRLGTLNDIVHPERVYRHKDADRHTFFNAYGGRRLVFPFKWLRLIKSITFMGVEK